jgi:hypothetical protein
MIAAFDGHKNLRGCLDIRDESLALRRDGKVIALPLEEEQGGADVHAQPPEDDLITLTVGAVWRERSRLVQVPPRSHTRH